MSHDGSPDLTDEGAENAPENNGAATQPVGDGSEEKGPEGHARQCSGVLHSLSGHILEQDGDTSWSAYSIGLLDASFAIDLGLLGQIQLAR